MATDLQTPRERAGICLKFIVVGAGISGLATAYALSSAGHDVLVLERSNGEIKSTGGIQSPPNVTKLLYKWGLGPTLQEKAHSCDKFIFKNGNSGAVIGSMALDEEFLKDLLADFLFLQHKDLYDMLFNIAVQEGVEFRFNAKVIEADPSSVSVVLESGEILGADVIVGADGYDSLLRQVVTDSDGMDSEEGLDERHVILTWLLPTSKMEADADLRRLLNIKEWVVWLGEGYIINSNVLVGGEEFTTTIIHDYKGPKQPEDEEWSNKRSLEYFGLCLNNFEPTVQKLLKIAQSVSSRTYVLRRSIPEDIVCHESRIVLTGEAAHPLLPGSNHGTALILDDAQTLGLLFSRVQNRNQISKLLTAYEEIRHPHCAGAQAYDLQQRRSMKVPVGPRQDDRDAILRQTMAYGDWDHMDEATFRAVWGKELALFAHDASDNVEDWWGHWGSLIMRGDIDGASMEISESIGELSILQAAH